MDGLPFTSKRTSWFAGLVLVALSYFIYYVLAFGPLLNSYKSYFDSGSFNESKDNLVVWVEVPRYYFNAGPSSLYVHVKNDGDSAVERVMIYLLKSPDLETLSLPLPYLDNDKTNDFSGGVEFILVAPGATITKRIAFITQAEATLTGILLQVGDSDYETLPAKKNINLGESSVKALRIEILEHLLLPPWSNAFILTLILLSIFLIHHKEKVSDVEPELFESLIFLNREWWYQALEDFVKSLLVLIVFLATTGLVFSLFDRIKVETFFPLIIIVLFTPVAIYGWLNRENKNMGQIMSFLGFAVTGIVVWRIWRAPDILLSSDGRLVWAVLFLEGLIVLIWSRTLTFSNPTSPSA